MCIILYCSFTLDPHGKSLSCAQGIIKMIPVSRELRLGFLHNAIGKAADLPPKSWCTHKVYHKC